MSLMVAHWHWHWATMFEKDLSSPDCRHVMRVLYEKPATYLCATKAREHHVKSQDFDTLSRVLDKICDIGQRRLSIKSHCQSNVSGRNVRYTKQDLGFSLNLLFFSFSFF